MSTPSDAPTTAKMARRNSASLDSLKGVQATASTSATTKARAVEAAPPQELPFFKKLEGEIQSAVKRKLASRKPVLTIQGVHTAHKYNLTLPPEFAGPVNQRLVESKNPGDFLAGCRERVKRAMQAEFGKQDAHRAIMDELVKQYRPNPSPGRDLIRAHEARMTGVESVEPPLDRGKKISKAGLSDLVSLPKHEVEARLLDIVSTSNAEKKVIDAAIQEVFKEQDEFQASYDKLLSTHRDTHASVLEGLIHASSRDMAALGREAVGEGSVEKLQGSISQQIEAVGRRHEASIRAAMDTAVKAGEAFAHRFEDMEQEKTPKTLEKATALEAQARELSQRLNGMALEDIDQALFTSIRELSNNIGVVKRLVMEKAGPKSQAGKIMECACDSANEALAKVALVCGRADLEKDLGFLSQFIAQMPAVIGQDGVSPNLMPWIKELFGDAAAEQARQATV